MPGQPAAPGPLGAPERLLLRLEWQVLRRLDGRLQGGYRTLFRGSGIDVADLREYQAGDDLRHIDWNVTARTDIPHVREYQEDRELTAWLLLDRTASMTFGPVARGKDVLLTELAATLARLLTRGGNRVGAVLFEATGATRPGDTAGQRPRILPPRPGRRQVLALLRELLAEPERGGHPGGATDLAGLFAPAIGMIRQRCLVVVVSDFISAPGWEAPLATLGKRHDVLAIQLLDPRESRLPAVGVVVVEDTETGEQLLIDTDDAPFRARLAELAAARQDRLHTAARTAGAELHTVGTDEDMVRALVRIAAARSSRARRPR